MLISPAYAQSLGGGGDIIGTILPFVLIFVIFYFLLIRPQQKKQKEHKAKISAIKKGDHVLLGGGIYGTVVKTTGEHDAEIEIANGVVIKVVKQTIIDIVNRDGSTKKDTPTAKPAAKKVSNAKGKPAARNSSTKKTAANDTQEPEDAVEVKDTTKN